MSTYPSQNFTIPVRKSGAWLYAQHRRPPTSSTQSQWESRRAEGHPDGAPGMMLQRSRSGSHYKRTLSAFVLHRFLSRRAPEDCTFPTHQKEQRGQHRGGLRPLPACRGSFSSAPYCRSGCPPSMENVHSCSLLGFETRTFRASYTTVSGTSSTHRVTDIHLFLSDRVVIQ